MRTLSRLAFLLAGWSLAAGSAAVTAQDDAGPGHEIYDRIGTAKAPTNKTEQERASEAHQARTFEVACEAGNRDACSDLGEAYELGAGKPQNRPVAAILYAEGCEMNHAASCYRLGRVTRIAKRDGVEVDAAAFSRKACDLGSHDGCAAYAYALDKGDGVPEDRELAHTILRRTCDEGGREACRVLAAEILRRDEPGAETASAIGWLERGCREGRIEDCNGLISFRRDINPSPGQLSYSELLHLACMARDAFNCAKLGDLALLGRDIPQDREYANQLHDLACEYATDSLEPSYCAMAQDLRSEAAWNAQCEAGDMHACAKAGAFHNFYGAPLYDAGKAQRLLERACNGGASEACAAAAQIALDDTNSPQPERALALFERGCAAGQEQACERLAHELDSGARLAQDKPRAYALYSDLCAGGYSVACKFLEVRAQIDPDTPLAIADARYIPPLDPNDPDARLAYLPEDERQEIADSCASSTVEFRGEVYSDEVCKSGYYVRNGYELEPGAAPWQALLWRPAGNLSQAQRVACGGTVIRTGWVLTAAHCLLEERGGRYFKIKYSNPETDHTIRLGVHNPRRNEGVIYPIRGIHMHPLFNIRNNYVFDIALIQYDHSNGRKLGTETQSIGILKPDPMPATGSNRRTISNDMPAYTYGWGWTEATNSSSTAALRGAKLKLKSEAACTQITRFEGNFLNSALCATGSEGQQACYGDSGGPLVYYGSPGSGPIVIGVVSAGKDCGIAGDASRYTRVAAARDWIDAVMSGRRR